jgi:hypothetical protein
MAAKTYQEQLEAVQKAIEAVEAGAQSYSLDNMHITRGNLKDLYDREKYLRMMAAREKRGGIRSWNGVPS